MLSGSQGQHSLLKIADLGFIACAAKKRGKVGSGNTYRILEDIFLECTGKLPVYSAYCAVQCF